MNHLGVYVQRFDWVNGRYFFDPIRPEWCSKCYREKPDLAHHVYEYVAALLAQRLRNALADHERQHPDCTGHAGMFGDLPECPEFSALAKLLPDGDAPILVG